MSTGPRPSSCSVLGSMLGAYAFLKSSQVSALGAFPKPAAAEAVALSQCVACTEWLSSAWLPCCWDWCCSTAGFAPARRCHCKGGAGHVRYYGAARSPSNWTAHRVLHPDECTSGHLPALGGSIAQPRPAGALYRCLRSRRFAQSPRGDFYRGKLAGALLELAERDASGSSFDQRIGRAAQTLIDAQALGSLNRGFDHLGELYLVWAARERDPDKRLALAQQASEALRRALIFDPHSESAWTVLANLYDQFFFNRPQEARRERAKALELIGKQDAGSFGDVYLAKARQTPFRLVQQCNAFAALACFRLGDSNVVGAGGNPFKHQIGQAEACLLLGDLKEAMACARAAIQTAPSGGAWEAEALAASVACTNRKTNRPHSSTSPPPWPTPLARPKQASPASNRLSTSFPRILARAAMQPSVRGRS